MLIIQIQHSFTLPYLHSIAFAATSDGTVIPIALAASEFIYVLVLGHCSYGRSEALASPFKI